MFKITFNNDSPSNKVVKVNSINEVKALLKESYNNAKPDYSQYDWDDEGNCGQPMGEEGLFERDDEKMIDKAIKRVEDFGWCYFYGANNFIHIINESKNK